MSDINEEFKQLFKTVDLDPIDVKRIDDSDLMSVASSKLVSNLTEAIKAFRKLAK